MCGGEATMGRPRINEEQMPARFPGGTLDRIDAALEEGEKRADLIRMAVEKELKRRERKSSS
jgi:metal-responsive CopG/Arc/MetJ family transcriptional regulator